MRFPVAARLAVLLVTLPAAHAAAADRTGAELYKAQCARCHGPAGAGVKKYDTPALTGDRSAVQLAKVVRDTMPESDPGSLTEAEALRIAEFMHAEFYSKDARDRLAPPRVELARLTVDQYRNTVADLVASFRPGPKLPPATGLRGEYNAGRGYREDRRKIDRTDPGVAFDFGTDGPGGGIDAAEFSVLWTGAVVPADTGVHEFVVRSDHAVKLWVNDPQKPLVDAWVKSGSDTEFTGSVHLTAGRPVYVKLEFSKARQGVKNAKTPAKPQSASVKLLWKPPGQPAEVVPARRLVPARVPEQFSVSTPFPPDDKSLGWVRGTTVSKAWEQATTAAALETSAYVALKLNQLAGTNDGDKDRLEKSKQFARKFADRAFRRPLSDADTQLFVDRHFAPGADPVLAVRKAVLLTLKSPRFLYREVGGAGDDGHATAARLSYALWDSLPDADLARAAAAGQLKTPEQVRKQAERMVDDPRAAGKLAGFVRHWLHVEGVTDLAKSKARFPAFDPAAAADLRTSLDLFTAEVVSSPESDFRRLLLADDVYLNARLANLYGVPEPKDGFQKVTLDAGKRAGVLTHPYLLSAFAYTAETSPIHRGVFLTRGVLGLSMKPPQEAFTPLAPDLHPTLSTRERVALQTSGATCQTCHSVINPLGFALEQFDAIGRFRDADNKKPVNPAGKYLTRDGKEVTFQGARELAEYLAASPEVHDSFARQLFHHLAQQPVRAYGADHQDKLRESFAANGFSVRKLAVEVAVTAATTPRGPVAVPPPVGTEVKGGG